MKNRSDLSAAECQLQSLMGGVWFGRIEGLVVAGGQPILPPAQVVRNLKFGAAPAAPVPEESRNFELPKEAVEFFSFLRKLGDGEINRVEVRYGLPVAAELDGSAVLPG